MELCWGLAVWCDLSSQVEEVAAAVVEEAVFQWVAPWRKAADWGAPLQYSPSSVVTGAASSTALASSPHCAALHEAYAVPVHVLQALLVTAPA